MVNSAPRRVCPSRWPPEDVADPADRVEKGRVRGVVLDLAAQPVDVHVNGARLARVVVAPYVLEQLVAREHLARMAKQEREQLEGLRLDRQSLAVAQEPVA